MTRRNKFLPNLQDTRNELAGMPSVESYLAGTRSDKREKQAIQEVRLRAAIMVGRGILDKMAMDYRFAARAYAFRRLDAAFAEMLAVLDEPRSKVHRDYTEDLVHNSVQELYREIMALLRASGREIEELIDKPLYPENEDEKLWWQQLGLFR